LAKEEVTVIMLDTGLAGKVVIVTGAVNTGWLLPETEKNLAGTYPLRRLGKPEDIANAVIFMASVQADWITGQVLFVSGGNRM